MLRGCTVICGTHWTTLLRVERTTQIPVAVAEELIDYLRARRAQMRGPDGESPQEWSGETELLGWIHELNVALGLAGRRPR